jgi:hypothetical protein
VADPRIALLFMVPGMQETLRVNGRAAVSRNPELCESFAVKENARGLSLLFASRAFTSNAVAQFYAVSQEREAAMPWTQASAVPSR